MNSVHIHLHLKKTFYCSANSELMILHFIKLGTHVQISKTLRIVRSETGHLSANECFSLSLSLSLSLFLLLLDWKSYIPDSFLDITTKYTNNY